MAMIPKENFIVASKGVRSTLLVGGGFCGGPERNLLDGDFQDAEFYCGVDVSDAHVVGGGGFYGGPARNLLDGGRLRHWCHRHCI